MRPQSIPAPEPEDAGRKVALAILAGVALLIVALGYSAWLAGSRIDAASRQREEQLVGNGLKLHAEEMRRSLAPNTIWDDALLHLDVRFDPKWAREDIGQYFWRSDGYQLVYVLDGRGRPIFGFERGHVVDPARFGELTAAIGPALDSIRAREAARTANDPSDLTPSASIDASTVGRRDGVAIRLAAALVQTDHSGQVHPSERAPIVVVGEVLDGAFVDRMRRRYLLDGVRIAPANPGAADRADSVPVKDFSGETVARLVWTPERPISRLMQDAGPPIAIALAALSAVVAFLLRHERRRNGALMQAAKEAKAASNAKSAFLATMSHEIRTPLNGVLGMARAMAGDELPPAQRQRLEVVSRSGESLLSLLNDLLDLAKVEAGKLELEAAPFDIGGVVESVRAMFVGVAQGKGVALETIVDADAGGAYVGDASKVRQIIVNLASNALKFTDHGSARVAVARTQRGIEIRVSDTGIGIPADRLASLFQKFEQADASTTRRYGGTGLGLAICREFSELMGGSIRAESEAGSGATFIVELPLQRLEGEGAPAQAATPAPAPAALEGPPLRVLAAEDNKINQLVLRTLLNQAGIEPVIVDDGQAAVDAWASGVWDVILMDVQMPVMDGPTATRAIRERERQQRRAPTPIIALTANVMAHQVRDYELAGMNGWVAKPIEVGALFASLQAALSPQPQDEARSA